MAVRSRALLEAIIESAPIALIVSDAQGTLHLVNHAAEILFGYEREELIGHSIDMLLPVAVRESHPAVRDAFMRHPSPRQMGIGRDLAALRKDGSEVPVEIGLTPIGTADDRLVLSVIADVSLRRRQADEASRANEILEQRVRARTAQLEQANLEKEALLADLLIQRSELERLSREDPLTKLSNRRDFDERLDVEVHRSRRLGTPLTVAMLDLDRFKEVNDRFGHALGDRVLRETAELIRHECRAIDVIARYGGEEFALVLPAADAHSGAMVCERIRLAFERYDWTRLQPGLAVTLSAGVAQWHPSSDAKFIMAQADARLYEAKRQGRNRVIASS